MSSLNLSEFLDNDESDGHRLAEFLQKKRGGVQRQNFVYLGFQTQRKSLKVQLEKPESQDIVEKEPSDGNKVSEGDELEDYNGQDHESSVETQLAKLHGESETTPAPDINPTRNVSLSPSVQNVCLGTVSPSSPTKRSDLVSPSSPARPSSPSRPLSPVRPSNTARPLSPSRPSSPVRPLSPIKSSSPSRTLSPRLASIRKSGGISPGDRLRRLSLKRLSTKNHCGRRTLLREFESTVNESDFQPPTCSTPLSQPIQLPTPIFSPNTDSPNLTSNNSKKCTDLSDICCIRTESIVKSLRHTDEALKNYMENVVETTLKKLQDHEKEKSKGTNNENLSANSQAKVHSTQSPLKRTYLIEKGHSPGQVILTPDTSAASSNSPNTRLLRPRLEKRPDNNISLNPTIAQPSFNKLMKTPERSINRSMISIHIKSPKSLNSSAQRLSQHLRRSENRTLSTGRGYIMLEKSLLNTTPVKTVNTTPVKTVIENTPPRNSSITFSNQEAMDVEIPETQEVAGTEYENNIVIRSNNGSHMVVVPVHQIFNQSGQLSPTIPIITAKVKTPPLQKNSNENEQNNMPEDNLKLTDILTDDDDDNTPKAASVCLEDNNSHAPLNLAPSATNKRTKRLRKRSLSRRRLQMDRSQMLSTETETEPPVAAHSSKISHRRREVKRKHIPLNRAPGTPLNGEKFAIELKRMSYYEILDLRKRNSIGRVFPISGRKSSRRTDNINKMQLQLDDDIELELLRRKLEQSTSNSNINLPHTETNQNDGSEYPPVPDEFRDHSQQQEEDLPVPEQLDDNQEKLRESSLVDETSNDRISFKSKKRLSLQGKRSKKRHVKSMSPVLKQYLEISNMLKKKNKTRKHSPNQTKRSLYTQGNSDSEDGAERTSIKSNNKRITTPKSQRKAETHEKSSLLPYVPSPPPSSESDEMPSLRIVSPPPPLINSQAQITEEEREHSQMEEILPPPPPEFDSDSGVSSNNLQTNYSEQQTLPLSSNEITSNNDDNLFKKPLPPPPTKKSHVKKRKQIEHDTLINDMQKSQDISSEDSSLRRSKREIKKPSMPIFQILYQASVDRTIERYEARKRREKERSKMNAIKSSSNGRPRKKLPSVSEGDEEALIASLENEAKKVLKKAEGKRKDNKKNKLNIDVECSRINLAAAPPLDHFNKVFNHLRDTSSAETVVSEPIRRERQQDVNGHILKCKNFRIPIKRMSFSPQINETQPVSESTEEPPTYNNQLNGVDSTSMSSTNSVTSTNNSTNFELISWLKNITRNECTSPNEILKEMRVSSATNLYFSTLQGVEYAFYDTDDKSSLGYLRFKPGQIKPKKKTKLYNLHFVTLVGQFRITANDTEKIVGVGDMIAIQKTVYYDIKNITDDVAILMVIKK